MTTSNKQLEQPVFNSFPDTWGTGPLNQNFGYLDLALGGSTTLNATGLGGSTVALSAAQCRPQTLIVTGTLTAAVTYTVPSGIGGQWVVRNSTSGGYAVRIQSGGGGGYVTVDYGANRLVSCDGGSTGMVESVTLPTGGGGGAAGGSNTQVQYNNSGLLAGSANMTFDGTKLTAAQLASTGALTVGGLTTTGTLALTGASIALGTTTAIGGTLNISPSATTVGIGTSPGSDKLTVAGSLRVTATGIYFPDNSLQTTAAGASTAPGASSTTGPGSDLTLTGGGGAQQMASTTIPITVSSGTQKWLLIAYAQVNITSGTTAFVDLIINGTPTFGTVAQQNVAVQSPATNTSAMCAAIVDISGSYSFSIYGANYSGSTTVVMRGSGSRLIAVRLS